MGLVLHCSSCLGIFAELEGFLEEDCLLPIVQPVIKGKKPLMGYLLLNEEQCQHQDLEQELRECEKVSNGRAKSQG